MDYRLTSVGWPAPAKKKGGSLGKHVKGYLWHTSKKVPGFLVDSGKSYAAEELTKKLKGGARKKRKGKGLLGNILAPIGHAAGSFLGDTVGGLFGLGKKKRRGGAEVVPVLVGAGRKRTTRRPKTLRVGGAQIVPVLVGAGRKRTTRKRTGGLLLPPGFPETTVLPFRPTVY